MPTWHLFESSVDLQNKEQYYVLLEIVIWLRDLSFWVIFKLLENLVQPHVFSEHLSNFYFHLTCIWFISWSLGSLIDPLVHQMIIIWFNNWSFGSPVDHHLVLQLIMIWFTNWSLFHQLDIIWIHQLIIIWR